MTSDDKNDPSETTENTSLDLLAEDEAKPSTKAVSKKKPVKMTRPPSARDKAQTLIDEFDLEQVQAVARKHVRDDEEFEYFLLCRQTGQAHPGIFFTENPTNNAGLIRWANLSASPATTPTVRTPTT